MAKKFGAAAIGSSQRSLCNKQLRVIIKSITVPRNSKLLSGGKENRRSGAGHFQGWGLFNKLVLWRFISDGTNDSCERWTRAAGISNQRDVGFNPPSP